MPGQIYWSGVHAMRGDCYRGGRTGTSSAPIEPRGRPRHVSAHARSLMLCRMLLSCIVWLRLSMLAHAGFPACSGACMCGLRAHALCAAFRTRWRVVGSRPPLSSGLSGAEPRFLCLCSFQAELALATWAAGARRSCRQQVVMPSASWCASPFREQRLPCALTGANGWCPETCAFVSGNAVCLGVVCRYMFCSATSLLVSPPAVLFSDLAECLSAPLQCIR